jgi:diacylglycerol kinase (ATP)
MDRMRAPKNQAFLRRLGFALAGLRTGMRAEHSLRFQAAACGGVLVALCMFKPEPIWWAVTGLASALVIMAELLNTAIEHLVDHLHPDAHPRIGVVKDVAAAAVLMAVLGALGVAAALLVHLFNR